MEKDSTTSISKALTGVTNAEISIGLLDIPMSFGTIPNPHASRIVNRASLIPLRYALVPKSPTAPPRYLANHLHAPIFRWDEIMSTIYLPTDGSCMNQAFIKPVPQHTKKTWWPRQTAGMLAVSFREGRIHIRQIPGVKIR